MISDELLTRMGDPTKELPVLVTLREAGSAAELESMGLRVDKGFPEIRVVSGRALPAAIRAIAACALVERIEFDGQAEAN